MSAFTFALSCLSFASLAYGAWHDHAIISSNAQMDLMTLRSQAENSARVATEIATFNSKPSPQEISNRLDDLLRKSNAQHISDDTKKQIAASIASHFSYSSKIETFTLRENQQEGRLDVLSVASIHNGNQVDVACVVQSVSASLPPLITHRRWNGYRRKCKLGFCSNKWGERHENVPRGLLSEESTLLLGVLRDRASADLDQKLQAIGML
ncbi:uncharacterized protein MONBRDRAFT_27730 [Monosiga brevicollis MX1]|uniref:Uncharacterized protein n=1 Tax=Monosiga brevicollis TaxID=81824 RepID=A9V653_MONBE|nr:uncharacterized protein MONBRDRAFT_27730 [Monosiga brevicollis MX1]EDQ86930.1 predicted protein [Monosiga brevicollis MX1]|eukprot:XP_001748169.1 hypothetical protein [Monosiga brevicollis MX1]